MKKLLYILLFAPAVFFACWVARMEYAKSQMQRVLVSARGYDPVDLFRGHYLWLRVDWASTDCSQFPGNSCPRDEFQSGYRFYLNQRKAKGLDEPMRDTGWAGKIEKIEMVFFYAVGKKPLLDTVLIDGIPYSEWYKKNTEK